MKFNYGHYYYNLLVKDIFYFRKFKYVFLSFS
jgi:hypothetical protein